MNRLLPLSMALAALALPGCNRGDGGNAAGSDVKASGEASAKTIAAGIDGNSRFAQAAKAAGLDQTLAGPGPYTVLVPSDDAFAKLPAGTTDAWGQPAARADVTRVLTYHILPGTILASDIAKAIDNSKGSAQLATMGGGILTATREGEKIVLTDGAGAKATVTKADDRYSNGVVHHIDTVLMPGANDAPAPQPGQNAP
jgi:uncharacterized surface protein with fasciclin (FAS1) repeats